MKCGECLMNHVRMVDLVNGVCPECGADYRGEARPAADRGPPTDAQMGDLIESLERETKS